MFVVLSVPIARNCQLRPNGLSWRLLVNEYIANIGILLDLFRFSVSRTFWFLKFYEVCGCLQTSLLCLVVELAGGGSVAVAVGVSDRRQDATCDMCHVTHDMTTDNLCLGEGPFLSFSVRFGMGATIRAHQKIHCLPYAGF